jgi:SAM-dependent methyltransferase
MSTEQKCFLNVGGGSKTIPVPDCFRTWRHDLLDIDPTVGPDICMDARELHKSAGSVYDAVYCSHNLEHYYRHHARVVVQNFIHVLKPDGFAYICVPDLRAVIEEVARHNLDLEDILYEIDGHKILVRDVIYGWSVEIEQSDKDFYAHKTGFSAKSLTRLLLECGFKGVYTGTSEPFNLIALAYKELPTDEQKKMFGLK